MKSLILAAALEVLSSTEGLQEHTDLRANVVQYPEIFAIVDDRRKQLSNRIAAVQPTMGPGPETNPKSTNIGRFTSVQFNFDQTVDRPQGIQSYPRSSEF